MNDTNNSDDSGFMQRIKESPRTVSALIIILIVAAAIYAFSDRQPQQNNESSETTDQTAISEETTLPEGTVSDTTEPNTTATATAKPTKAPAKATPLPEASRNDQGFVEVAQQGEGITHLARRSADRWLQENQAGYNVSAEHRVYIEDYIQNKVGHEGLKLGETRTVSYDLIAEAVNNAKNLSDTQLKHLSRYTPR